MVNKAICVYQLDKQYISKLLTSEKDCKAKPLWDPIQAIQILKKVIPVKMTRWKKTSWLLYNKYVELLCLRVSGRVHLMNTQVGNLKTKQPAKIYSPPSFAISSLMISNFVRLSLKNVDYVVNTI